MPKAKQIERARGEEPAASPLDAAFKLVDSLAVPVFFKSRDGRYLGVNRAWEEFFGIKGEAFIGKQVADLYPKDPAIAERHAAMDRELYARPGRQSYEITVRTRGGELRDTIYYKATYSDARGEVAGLIGAIIDITARTRAERALRQNEERWRAIFNSANEGILVYDRELSIVAGNQAAERIIGLPLAEIIGAPGFTSLLRCVHADGRPVLPDERPTRIMVRTGKPLTGHVVGIKRPGGALTWLSVNTGFLRHHDSADWYGVVSSFTDITAQRNAESALRESEERYRRTFELAGSGLAHVGLDGRFLRVNRRLCEFLGYSERELVGMMVKDLSHPEDRDAVDARREKLIAGEVDSVRIEKRYLRKDGATVWAHLAIAMERDAAGKPLYAISVLDDITQRKQTDAALRESEERYRRTFELAGSGVAHIALDRKLHPRQPAPVRDPRLPRARADRHDRTADLASGRPRRHQPGAREALRRRDRRTCASRSATCARTARWCGCGSAWWSSATTPASRSTRSRSSTTSPSESAPRKRCARARRAFAA